MISPRSRLAFIFASLIVSASSYVLSADRAPAQRLSVVRLKFGLYEKQAWISAINNDRVDQLLLMLDQHDVSKLMSVTAANGKSALMVASKRGSLSLARQMLNAGADVNESTATNGTPLMFAVVGGQPEMARWLVERGADIHRAGSNGWTAITIAAAKGYLDILQWLVEAGGDSQVRDVYRFTPLLRAVENGFVDVVEYLLSLPKTDVNAQDEYDNTALHHAIGQKHTDIIRLLLKHGADPQIKNRDGLTPASLDPAITDLQD